MILIAAVDKNWAIGYRQEMLFDLPKDRQFFREQTLGNVVIYGRSTLETLPGGMPFQGRDNLVLSNFLTLAVDGAQVVDLETLPLAIDTYQREGRQIYIAGGGSVYRQLLPYATSALITYVDARATQVDTFFPNLDMEDQWELVFESAPMKDGDHQYTLRKYENKAPKSLAL